MLLSVLATTPRLAALVAALICLAAPITMADEGDDTLKFFLSRSELIVSGRITTDPTGMSEEVGVFNYTCEFQIQDVLKGDTSLKGRDINVRIIRFERDARDKHPLIKKDKECILFLKSAPNASPTAPAWVTADCWFGVQEPGPWMARSLKRLTAQRAKPAGAASANQPAPPNTLAQKQTTHPSFEIYLTRLP